MKNIRFISGVNKQEALITIVRPLRIDASNEFLIDRIDNYKKDSFIPNDVKFLIVDEGSDEVYVHKIAEICQKNKIGFVSLMPTGDPFSPGRARNYGAQLANSKYIFLQDIDLMPYDHFYEDIIDQIKVSHLDSDVNQFAMVSCIYLTEKESSVYSGSQAEKKYLIRECLAGNESVVERISTGTSACLFNRYEFLRCGGTDPFYKAWGYEDLDLNCRWIRKSKLFPIPEDWASDRYNFNSVLEYKGWKASYRLYGDMTLCQGIVLFHQWHPAHKSKTDHASDVRKNRDYFLSHLKGSHPLKPLADYTRGATLVMKKCAFTFNGSVGFLYGDVYFYESDVKDKSISGVLDFIKIKNISRVIFFNPYANKEIEGIYEAVKQSGVKAFIAERGALPGSHFYDPSGFLFNSDKYKKRHWDGDINAGKLNSVKEFRERMMSENLSLETQGATKSQEELRSKYNIGDKKVIFVPLQRPHDTAVVKFGRKLSYVDYINEVSKLIEAVSVSNYVVLIKKHPLEDTVPEQLSNAKFVDADENTNSLIVLSDAVVTFTSGCGLLGLLFHKKVFTAGNAFYSQDGLTINFDDCESILSSLNEKPNIDLIDKFLAYLINDYYCFGNFTVKPVVMPDGTRMTATTRIVDRLINFDGIHLEITDATTPRIDWRSMLFDRYKAAKTMAGLPTKKQIVTPADKMSLRQKRLKKLKNDPYRYFKDSSHFLLRLIAPLFK